MTHGEIHSTPLPELTTTSNSSEKLLIEAAVGRAKTNAPVSWRRVTHPQLGDVRQLSILAGVGSEDDTPISLKPYDVITVSEVVEPESEGVKVRVDVSRSGDSPYFRCELSGDGQVTTFGLGGTADVVKGAAFRPMIRNMTEVKQ